MKFGGIVSTSNKYESAADIVEVTTDKPILWSMGISTIDDDWLENSEDDWKLQLWFLIWFIIDNFPQHDERHGRKLSEILSDFTYTTLTICTVKQNLMQRNEVT